MVFSNDDLFLAIISMDAYNRNGGEAGISVSLKMNGTSLGNATLSIASGNVSSGFFAQSYLLSGTQKVISFRGADFNTPIEAGKDILHGWIGPHRTGGQAIRNRSDLIKRMEQRVVA